jgi:nucleoid-associated protein YgaU
MAERKVADAQAEVVRLNQALVAANERPAVSLPASAPSREVAVATAPRETARPTASTSSAPVASAAPASISAPALSAPARPAVANSAGTAASPVATAAKVVKPEAPANASATTPRFHTVAIGDTLSKISLHYYGTTSRWSEILTANRDLLRDERSLVAGRILRIP